MTTSAPTLPVELEPILDTVLDAVIVLDKVGVVVAWNKVAETTFGWNAQEAVGQPLSELIVPTQHREAHRAGMDRLKSGGEPHVLNRRIELPALCKDGRQIPIELSITTSRGTGREYFIGFLRDIEERQRAQDVLERQLEEQKIMLDVTRMAADAQSFEEAVRIVLKTICGLTGWEAGHAFLVDKNDPDLLHASEIWYEEHEGDAERMREASTGLSFRRGNGLPGRVLEADAPVWLSDINLEGNFIRKGNEFRGAFGFPLRSEGKIIAVLEFFSPHRSSPDERLLLLAQALGSQLGRVLERSQTHEQREVLLHELNHRNKNLLTVIQSMARMTFNGIGEARGALETFASRLSAMAAAQDVLVEGQWTDSTMREVVQAALTNFVAYAGRFTIEGPAARVAAGDIQGTVLIVHELCTNALKYGALAHDNGRVSVRWGYEGEGEERRFYFTWEESGCNLDGRPPKRGFGSNLLKRGLSSASASTIDIDYRREGVRYHMVVPAPEQVTIEP